MICGAAKVAFCAGLTAFVGRWAAADLRARLVRRAAARVDRDALIVLLSSTRRAGFIYLLLQNPSSPQGLRRSTMTLSERRLLRVLAPRVGKPQGVCGWLPLTRPSPPPCG